MGDMFRSLDRSGDYREKSIHVLRRIQKMGRNPDAPFTQRNHKLLFS
jgi:hypothetical protein